MCCCPGALCVPILVLPLQGNFTFTAELIVALIAFITAVWLSLYMGWAIHSLRLIPRFTNTLLACCGKQYEVSVLEKRFTVLRGHANCSSRAVVSRRHAAAQTDVQRSGVVVGVGVRVRLLS